MVKSSSLTRFTLNLAKLHVVCQRGREGKIIRSLRYSPLPYILTCLAQLPMEYSRFGLYPYPKFSKLELSFKHHFEQSFRKECRQRRKKNCFLVLKMQSLTWSFNQGAESYYMLMTPQRQKSRKFITGV